jgi:hypothetical protein
MVQTSSSNWCLDILIISGILARFVEWHDIHHFEAAYLPIFSYQFFVLILIDKSGGLGFAMGIIFYGSNLPFKAFRRGAGDSTWL